MADSHIFSRRLGSGWSECPEAPLFLIPIAEMKVRASPLPDRPVRPAFSIGDYRFGLDGRF
jgi:hypothetical protein